MIHAKPNPNGNTTEDFEAAYVALQKAREAIEAAATKLLCDVANGRNYQHLASPDAAIISDRRLIQEVARRANASLGSLQSDLVNVIEGLQT